MSAAAGGSGSGSTDGLNALVEAAAAAAKEFNTNKSSITNANIARMKPGYNAAYAQLKSSSTIRNITSGSHDLAMAIFQAIAAMYPTLTETQRSALQVAGQTALYKAVAMRAKGEEISPELVAGLAVLVLNELEPHTRTMGGRRRHSKRRSTHGRKRKMHRRRTLRHR
jgi:hypothetical protein